MIKSETTLAFIISVYLAEVLITSSSSAETWKMLENSRLGCRTADILIDASKQTSPDRYLMDRLKAGDCRLLPVGRVQVEAVSAAGEIPPQSCVKPQGFDICWWVPSEVIR